MEMPSEAEVRAIVRRVLLRTLGMTPPAHRSPRSSDTGPGHPARPLITEASVNRAPAHSALEVPADALVTPLARDAAEVRGIQLVSADRPSSPTPPLPQLRERGTGGEGRTIALGADHGGYKLKEALKGLLDELGYTVVDCGTNSPDAVDYPDFAYSVARLVADGRAWRGIIVDGVGIGSSIAANKVPGIRAALCYDQATAVNSREHNDANVLTLGAGLIGENLARQIVKTWLQTEFGGGRHARRVAKIGEIERRFLVKRGA
jgi:ribose 5-phosphate isomerase B